MASVLDKYPVGEYTMQVSTAADPIRTAPPTWVENAQLIAMEMAPSMGGALIGSFLGGWVGGSLGGAGGSYLGNKWAQNLRQEMGFADHINPGELVAATLTGGIPLGSFAKGGVLAKFGSSGMGVKAGIRGTQGAAMAGGDLMIRTYADEKRLPTEQEWKTALLFGGITGGVLGSIEAKFFRDVTGNDAIVEGQTPTQVRSILKGELEEAFVTKQEMDKLVKQGVTERGHTTDGMPLTPAWAEDWQVSVKDLEDIDQYVDTKFNQIGEIAANALDEVPLSQLPQNAIAQDEAKSSSWHLAVNQPQQKLDVVGTQPARIAQDTIADLKAAMTGGTQEMPVLEDLKTIRKGIDSVDAELRKPNLPRQKKRELKSTRSQLREREAQAENQLSDYPEYNQAYSRIEELEANLENIENLASSVQQDARGKYIAAARKMRQELHEERTKLDKYEQMAKEAMPANKFAQYVASGGLMAGLPVAYFSDDEDGEYSLASGFSIAAGLSAIGLALILGRGAKNIPQAARSLREATKNLKMPKVRMVKGKPKVPVSDQPLDYSEHVVKNAETSPYQHSNLRTLRDHAVKLGNHVASTLSRRLKSLPMGEKLNTFFQEAEQKISTMKKDLKIQSLFMYAMEDAARKGGFMDEFRRAWGMEGVESSQAMAKLFEANKKAVTQSARVLAKKQGIKNADGIKLGFGEGSGDYTYSMYRKAMDSLFDELGESGMDIGYRSGYNPRLVKDYNQFREFLEKRGTVYKPILDQKLAEYAKKHNKSVADISKHEEAQVLSRLFAQMRGEEGKPGFAKQRVFTQIDDDMLDAYEDPARALSSYISQASEKAVARKFLGKGIKGEFDTGMQSIDESLAGKMAKAIGKDYGIETPQQLAELQDIIQKRFNSAPVNPLVQLWRNSNYFTTIANIGTTVTQLMDLINTFYFAGSGNAFNAMVKRGKTDWFNELGLDHHNSVDFGATGGGLNKALDWVLTQTKFNQLDKWAKNVSLEALYNKYKSKATNDAGALMKELTGEFGASRAQEIVKQLQNWKGAIDGVTPTPPEIQHLLFTKAADFLPLSRLEMPGAAEGQFAPLFYQLKTYTIKQFDIYREINQGRLGKAVRLLGEGKNAEAAKVALPAIKGLAGYGAMLAMSGATTDMIKDTMYGRPVELDDTIKNNLFRLALINRYHVYRMERDGLGKTFLDYIAPATTTVDRLSKDISAFVQGEDFKGHSLQGTPLDVIYWGMEGMGGYEKTHR